MAKSKALTKKKPKTTKDADAPLTASVSNGDPYQLDPAQVERAATALISHMKKHAEAKEKEASKKNLAADEDDSEPNDADIFLNVTTKKHIEDRKRLKPNRMLVDSQVFPCNC